MIATLHAKMIDVDQKTGCGTRNSYSDIAADDKRPRWTTYRQESIWARTTTSWSEEEGGRKPLGVAVFGFGGSRSSSQSADALAVAC